MAGWIFRGKGLGRTLAAAAVLSAGIGLMGCGKGSPRADNASTPADEGASKPTAVDSPSTAATSEPKLPPFGDDDPLHEPLPKAARLFGDPPMGAVLPPDCTITGKSTIALQARVADLWETIRFKTLDGKTIDYSAQIETEHGAITIALRPDAAPNHVRNFVALAMAGYYDGLTFDRMQAQESPAGFDVAPVKLESLEAGNPRGPEEANGSIGYWLYPEFSDKLRHEEGTVGACREIFDAPDSAGCRFYVMLTKDAVLDGHCTAFGKVTAGLDVAHENICNAGS